MRVITDFRRLGAAVAAGLVVAACSDGTGPVGDEESAGAAAIASFLLDHDMMGSAVRGMSFDPRTGTFTFTRTGPCPAGGTQSSNGTTTSALNATTKVLSVTWNTTMTHDDCAFTHTRGDRQVKTTINGQVAVTGSSTTQLPPDRTTPPKLLSHTSTTKGATTTTTVTNGSTVTKTCEMDVTETYDPATNTYTMKGLVCGQQVTVTRTPRMPPRTR